MKNEFALIGAGRLGRTLGRLLRRHGYSPAGLSCRSLRSARQASAFIGAGEPTTSNAQAAARAPLVLIATPDREIALVARELARARLPWTGRIVAHCSGAVSSAALEPLRRRRALVASIHPLASIAAARPDADFHGTPFAIEGDPRALRVLRRLVLDMGGLPVTIPREAKALYHLVACTLSNDLVAFLASGFEAARGLGLGTRQAARLYLPLIRGTVENVARLGPVKALTGPVSRGDIATLRLHAEALRTLPADVRRLHRILALRSSNLAVQAGTITPEVAGRIARLLGSQP
jgi:predicted short-subunit dehydrogenase-like oxidoreductase (DUF2520 family)